MRAAALIVAAIIAHELAASARPRVLICGAAGCSAEISTQHPTRAYVNALTGVQVAPR